MKKTSIIGFIFIVFGLTLYIGNIISDRERVLKDSNKVDYSLEKEISYKYVEKDLYDAVISILQIGLKRGIYKIDDKRNNIEENIMIHYTSIYPDKDNSNVILIAHSGSAINSFFKDLDKLTNDSLIEFYYNHTKYIYKIDKYYDVIKNGSVEIVREKNKKTITLITCNQVDKNMQTVYIGYLIDKIDY